jgi:hypothetical protein
MKIAGQLAYQIFASTFPLARVYMADSIYFVPRLQIYKDAHKDNLQWLGRELGIHEWHEELFDCDKFALMFRARMVGMNMVTQLKNPQIDIAPLPIATIYYHIGARRGMGHAINAGIYYDENDNFQVCCIEPQPTPKEKHQSGGIVNLTSEEKDSCWYVSF